MGETRNNAAEGFLVFLATAYGQKPECPKSSRLPAAPVVTRFSSHAKIVV
jgi:hypothetical protein